MSSENINPDVYTDFSRFSQLRGLARNESDKAMHEVASQFESLFLQMALKSMREASFDTGLMENDQTRLYRDMHDKQLSLELAKTSRLGLADLIVKQLGGEPLKSSESPSNARELNWYRENTIPLNIRADTNVSKAVAVNDIGQNEKIVKNSDDRPIKNSEEFVRKLFPYAERAAKKLGVDPKLLLAQAALETGWGKSLIRDGNGNVSYNLFGIKADHRWLGNKVSVPTLEFKDGLAEKQRADFRVYASFRESFEDYVRFLESNPRYQQALEHTDDPREFIRQLQKADYATDPKYAQKVIRIFERDEFANLTKTIAANSAPVSGKLSGLSGT